MEFTLAVALVAMIILTLVYRVLPYRLASDKKPSIALLPKYKKHISTSLMHSDLEGKLAQYGFKKLGSKNDTIYFTRGALLGDFSVKLMKIKLGVTPLEPYKFEITLQAGWLVAFDTGDFWTFITELSRKLETT